MVTDMNWTVAIRTTIIKNAIAPLYRQITDMQAGISFFNELAIDNGNSIIHEQFVLIKITDTLEIR